MTHLAQKPDQKLRKTAILCMVSLTLLGACREAEQGRISAFEPGVYQGAADAPLDTATVEALRNRAARNSDP